LRCTMEPAMNEALLAEDDPVSQRFLDEALQAGGWRCTVVADGTAALDHARRHRYALLVLDVNLPRIDGLTLLRRLRQSSDSASRNAPALALTADRDPALRERLLAGGFADVGRKPIGLGELARRVAHVLDGTPAIESHPSILWDEAAALRATGGRGEIVAALRDLMRRDLPAQRDAIVAAWQRGDEVGASAEIHRLQAACGFCGAARLSQALSDVALDSSAEARHAALAAIEAVLASR
jgi:CheY-like chemotaxis protein